MIRQTYHIGVDGGGTGCRARLTDSNGRILGEGQAGPANLSLGIDAALNSVMRATRIALANAGLADRALARTHAGLGLAAANVLACREAAERRALPFRSVTLRSDAEAACLGAHGGRDGAILILGTGSQGVLHHAGRYSTLGGWGFALSDGGSGAILGRSAVRCALRAHEGIEPASGLTDAIMEHFGRDCAAMVRWAREARPCDWAEFARLVFSHASSGDPVAARLVRTSAESAERMLDRLAALGARRISLMGGLAAPIGPYLNARFADLLVPAEGDAMDGALLIAREH